MNESLLQVPDSDLQLRLLSYNMQVGLDTAGYGGYVTGAWRHALPSRGMAARLDAIADVLRAYDFVALQEADAGSLRTRFRNQVHYLADQAEFPYWGLVVTRNLQPVARHCLGYLSRFPVDVEEDLPLPGRLPGRRVLRLKLRAGGGSLTVLMTHMSLGRQTQLRQLDFLGGLVQPDQPTVLMGDLNCDSSLLSAHPALRAAGFLVPEQAPATFPSWKPQRPIDHILVSPGVKLLRLETVNLRQSDHLPLAADIALVRA